MRSAVSSPPCVETDRKKLSRIPAVGLLPHARELEELFGPGLCIKGPYQSEVSCRTKTGFDLSSGQRAREDQPPNVTCSFENWWSETT